MEAAGSQAQTLFFYCLNSVWGVLGSCCTTFTVRQWRRRRQAGTVGDKTFYHIFIPPLNTATFLFSIYLHSHADVSLHTWTMSQDMLDIDGGTQTPSTASLDHSVLWLNKTVGVLGGKMGVPLTGTIKSAFFQPLSLQIRQHICILYDYA